MPALIGPGCSCCGNSGVEFYVKFCVAFNAFGVCVCVCALLYLMPYGESGERIGTENKSAFGQKTSFSKE